MTNPIIRFDKASDTLTVSFAPGEKATGVELNDHILLRMNKADRKAVGLTLMDYSLLVQPDEIDTRNFPLTGLSQISEDTRALVLMLLKTEPVNQFLTLSVYAPNFANAVPIASVKPVLAVA